MASTGGKLSAMPTDEECGRKTIEMQNVSDFLRISRFKTVVPNKSDAFMFKSDFHPHSSSAPCGGTFPPGEGIAAAPLTVR